MLGPKSKIGPANGTTRSLGALWAPTSSSRPFWPAFGPLGMLDVVFRALGLFWHQQTSGSTYRC